MVGLPIGDTSCADGSEAGIWGSTDGSGNADIQAGWESWSDNVDWFLGNPGYITSDDMLQMGIETEDSGDACVATFWYDLNDDAPVAGSVGGPGLDLVLNQYEIDPDDQVTVEARPIGQSTANSSDPIVGHGNTTDNGSIVVSLDDINTVTDDPAFETTDGDITLDVYYDDGSGNPEGSPALSVPENFGQYSSTDDPVLIQHRVLDANGNPVDDKTVTVHIVPVDTDSWPTPSPIRW